MTQKLYNAKFDVRKPKRYGGKSKVHHYDLALVASSKESVISTIEALDVFANGNLVFKSIKKIKRVEASPSLMDMKEKKRKKKNKKRKENKYGIAMYDYF